MDRTCQQSPLRSSNADISPLRILIAGAGIGSVIAECALRMGFRTLSVIDSGIVDSRDVSVYNYTARDLHTYKAWALTERLLEIDPEATICFSNIDLTPENVRQYVRRYDAVVNTFGYDSVMRLPLDEHCAEMGILSIHPFSLGWASFVSRTDDKSLGLDLFSPAKDGSCGEMARNITEMLKNRSQDQMAAAADKIAWQVCNLLCDVAAGRKVKLLSGNCTASLI